MDIPGIGIRISEIVLAEIGVNVEKFATASHLCSWAGLAPGNNESAGKRRSSKIGNGNKSLKVALVQAAQAAIKSENFFAAQYRKLVVRKGGKRAIIAVAHSILIAVYNVLKGDTFKDLGCDFYERKNPEKQARRQLIKLKNLGFTIEQIVEFLDEI